MATISQELGNKIIDSLLTDMGSPDWGSITTGLFPPLDGADVKKMSLLDKYDIDMSDIFPASASGKYGVKQLIDEGALRFIKDGITVEVPVTKTEIIEGATGHKHSGLWTHIRKELVMGLHKLSQLVEEKASSASWNVKVEKHEVGVDIGLEPLTVAEVIDNYEPVTVSGKTVDGAPAVEPVGETEGITEVSGSGYAKMKPTPTKVKAPKKAAVKKGKGEEAVPTEPVMLRDATMLYQPVTGTSSGSIYHVAALGKKCRMAVRISKSKLSLRVEGSLDDWNVALSQAGIGMKSAKAGAAYASVHLGVDSEQTARRTLGALLMATVEMWDTGMPQFDKLYLKGTG